MSSPSAPAAPRSTFVTVLAWYAPQLPPVFEFMLRHMRAIVFATLLLALTTLGSAIGLLKRRNWARLLFIVLLGLGIAWNLGGIGLYFVVDSAMPLPPDTPKDFADSFRTMANVMLVLQVLSAIGLSLLFGWLIKRLSSPEIRREFV